MQQDAGQGLFMLMDNIIQVSTHIQRLHIFVHCKKNTVGEDGNVSFSVRQYIMHHDL